MTTSCSRFVSPSLSPLRDLRSFLLLPRSPPTPRLVFHFLILIFLFRTSRRDISFPILFNLVSCILFVSRIFSAREREREILLQISLLDSCEIWFMLSRTKDRVLRIMDRSRVIFWQNLLKLIFIWDFYIAVNNRIIIFIIRIFKRKKFGDEVLNFIQPGQSYY